MKKRLTPLAIKLRKNQTPHEAKLWSYLRTRDFIEYKFRRQYPIENYIVDFCCPAKKLIIELDGSRHNEDNNMIEDKKRDGYLAGRGFIILRFWNSDIDENIDGVLGSIYDKLNR